MERGLSCSDREGFWWLVCSESDEVGFGFGFGFGFGGDLEEELQRMVNVLEENLVDLENKFGYFVVCEGCGMLKWTSTPVQSVAEPITPNSPTPHKAREKGISS